MSLLPDSVAFAEFFAAATGHAPTPYQQRWSAQWPVEVVDVPPGSGAGEGAVLAWLHRIAAGTPGTSTRLILAAPPEALPDQMRRHVDDFVARLEQAGHLPEGRVGVRVLDAGASGTGPDWRLYPDRPMILIGTSDQVISRALFRGSGVARPLLAIDAALVLNDAHVVLFDPSLTPQGTAALRQVVGWQHEPTDRQRFGPVGLTCVGTLLSHSHLDVVDNRWDGAAGVSLDEADAADPWMAPRLEGRRSLRSLDDCDVVDRRGRIDAAALAATVRTGHRQGTLSLVVVGSVDDATRVFRALTGSLHEGDLDVVLVHPRYRVLDRDERTGRAIDVAAKGGIIVTTAAAATGLDLDAAAVYGPAGTWPQIVHLAASANRAGGQDDARLYWWPDRGSSDTTAAAALEVLRGLDGAEVTVRELVDADPGPGYPLVRVPRRRDWLDLFATGSELAAGVDLGGFLLDDPRDPQIQVAWVQQDPATDARLLNVVPSPAQRCAVPRTALRELLKATDSTQAWVWRHYSGRWVSLAEVGQLRRGELVLLSSRIGGYDPDTGFDPAGAAIAVGEGEEAPLSDCLDMLAPAWVSEAPAQVGADWVKIEDRSGAAAAVMDELLAATAVSLGVEERRALVVAAKVMDLGKAHPDWQAAIRGAACAEHAASMPTDGLIATSPCSHGKVVVTTPADPAYGSSGTDGGVHRHDPNSRVQRRSFRHEAVAVAWLRGRGGPALMREHDLDPVARPLPVWLLVYLVGARHGNVRLGVVDPVSGGRDGRTIFGFGDGEELPAVIVFGHEFPAERVSIRDLLGMDGWVEECLQVLEHYGPARLAYLESLVQIADWRTTGRLNS